MTAAKLLDRLHSVRQSGPNRWTARCPSHEDKSPSLSIRETDDGTVLVKCWTGCGAADVVAAAGLTLKDLFPERPAEHRRGPSPPRIPATDVLIALDHEAHVVAIVGADVLEHKVIDQPTWERLAQAVHRIGDARALIAPLKVKVTA